MKEIKAWVWKILKLGLKLEVLKRKMEKFGRSAPRRILYFSPCLGFCKEMKVDVVVV